MAVYVYVSLLVLLLHSVYASPTPKDTTDTVTTDQPAIIYDGDAETNGEGLDDILLPEATGSFSLLAHPLFKWPGGVVPYKIGKMSKERKRVMKKAIRKVEAALKTPDGELCIDFISANRDSTIQQYLNITYSTRCAAGVGRWSAATPVYIGDLCSIGNMMHELMHTLGVFHEQSRNDRDEYIQVKYENIRSNAIANFYKAGDIATDLDTHYDYGSIMHYHAYAFSWNNEKTIVTKDPTAVIGQRQKLSVCDIERIQVHYGCKETVENCPKRSQ